MDCGYCGETEKGKDLEELWVESVTQKEGKIKPQRIFL